MSGLELRHLRYFIALGETRHFGRAAHGLRVSQPLLSRQIRELERIVGVALVAHTRPAVELTLAGMQFFEHAQQTLQQAERAVRAAHRAAGNLDRLAIAFEPCSAFHGFERSAGKLQRAMPNLQLDIREMPVAEHAIGLRSGEIDVASEPLLIVLPSGDELAVRKKVKLERLRSKPFLFWHRALAPACHDYVCDMLRANGVDATVRHRAPDHRKSLEMVAAGLGWTIAPACARNTRQNGVKFREIEGVDAKIEMGLSYLKGNTGPPMKEFLRCWVEASS